MSIFSPQEQLGTRPRVRTPAGAAMTSTVVRRRPQGRTRDARRAREDSHRRHYGPVRISAPGGPGQRPRGLRRSGRRAGRENEDTGSYDTGSFDTQRRHRATRSAATAGLRGAGEASGVGWPQRRGEADKAEAVTPAAPMPAGTSPRRSWPDAVRSADDYLASVASTALPGTSSPWTPRRRRYGQGRDREPGRRSPCPARFSSR